MAATQVESGGGSEGGSVLTLNGGAEDYGNRYGPFVPEVVRFRGSPLERSILGDVAATSALDLLADSDTVRSVGDTSPRHPLPRQFGRMTVHSQQVDWRN
jgi:hypothetical protein